MKNFQEGLMEEEIINEEMPETDPSGLAPAPQKRLIVKSQEKLLALLKNITGYLKKPKIITLVLLGLIAIVVYLGLNLLSRKNEEAAVDNTPKAVTSTSPQASINPKTAGITREIDNFKSKLENSPVDTAQLDPPKVDLNITF